MAEQGAGEASVRDEGAAAGATGAKGQRQDEASSPKRDPWFDLHGAQVNDEAVEAEVHALSSIRQDLVIDPPEYVAEMNEATDEWVKHYQDSEKSNVSQEHFVCGTLRKKGITLLDPLAGWTPPPSPPSRTNTRSTRSSGRSVLKNLFGLPNLPNVPNARQVPKARKPKEVEGPVMGATMFPRDESEIMGDIADIKRAIGPGASGTKRKHEEVQPGNAGGDVPVASFVEGEIIVMPRKWTGRGRLAWANAVVELNPDLKRARVSGGTSESGSADDGVTDDAGDSTSGASISDVEGASGAGTKGCEAMSFEEGTEDGDDGEDGGRGGRGGGDGSGEGGGSFGGGRATAKGGSDGHAQDSAS